MKSIATGLLVVLLGSVIMSAAHPVVRRSHAQISASSSITREELAKLAARHRKEPIDALINTAGKRNVIPEVNGVEVDQEETWKRINTGGRTASIPLVYRQIPPKIGMKDLEPLPIYQGNPVKKQIALMVNVAWGSEFIEHILKILHDNQVKATFFLDGSWLSKNETIAQQIVASGHEIGNHAYSHPDMAALPATKQREQIVRTQEEIRKRLGVISQWFAPPSGSFNDVTVKLAKKQNMGTVLWTLDTVDWRRPPKEQIIRRILPNAKNGALVLMHPTEPTVEALRTLVPSLKEKGFQLVTVSELLSPIRPFE
jgi:probable sporulation protein (polysaccharide deacetylase family)